MNRSRYIAIEGSIGVGKTTLAEKLSTFRRSNLCIESFDKNPFLEEFYSDPENNVLENSLQFLLLHCLQNKQIQRSKYSETIADFSHHKDPIFAGVNLTNETEKRIFDEACRILHAKLAPPDVVVFIRGDDSFIYNRILHRKRPMELALPMSYYSKINAAYENYFSSYSGPICLIEAASYDICESQDGIARISKMIDKTCTKLHHGSI